MSVTAHLTEQFVIKRKFSYLNIKWLILGAYVPDGWGLSKLLLAITDNAEYHREIIFGWLHSLPVSGLLCLPVFIIFGRRAGISVLVSAWLHVLTDTLDELGCKLFYPFSEKIYHFDIWPWTDENLWTDLFNYYTHPISGSIEMIFLILTLIILAKAGNSYNPIKGLKNMWKMDTWR